ncbi:lytic transglycosylase domain-containing protein [Aureivirga sp. CE67]|uniref:lytic transglycosylase domain-containing protein n=1 Tax=Aureivirga sp. CE67 TaxID=1788983 RepID=UPI0018CA92DA|nr:lytic transglycosylase domain-containing protein [Aureivirga sp. CE67]
MNKSLKYIGIIGVLGVTLTLINSKPLNELEEYVGKRDTVDINTSKLYEIKALKIPADLNFAGEKVPLEEHDVKERIDRELLVNTYWQSNGLLLIKRTEKYFPIIEPILKKHGVPDDFKYLAVIESGLMNVSSPAGAKGYWQLMKKTARELGLEVNDNVDERYDIEKSTEAACKYLLKSKERFGSWTLAAAAYNAGNAGVSRRMKAQKVDNYYDLLLVSETSRYVPRIIAVKEILGNPFKYGFSYEEEDLYKHPEFKRVEVDTAITSLADFAIKMNTNYKKLKIYNPWLRQSKLNNKSRKKYTIKLPQ